MPHQLFQRFDYYSYNILDFLELDQENPTYHNVQGYRCYFHFESGIFYCIYIGSVMSSLLRYNFIKRVLKNVIKRAFAEFKNSFRDEFNKILSQ